MLTLTVPCARCIAQLNARLTGNAFNGTNKIQVLHLLNKREDITLCAAAKTHVPTGFIINAERRCAFGMEWAESDLATTCATELSVGRNDVRQGDRTAHLLNVFLRDSHDTNISANEPSLRRATVFDDGSTH